MKKLTHVITALLIVSTFALLLSAAHTVVAKVPSQWAADSVARAKDLGLIPEDLQNGYTRPMTRAEICALAVNAYETATGRLIDAMCQFDDTDDINVQKMGGLEIVSAMDGESFMPNRHLTREQAAAILARLITKMNVQLVTEPAYYIDIDEISDWALEPVGQMQAMGIMGGMGEGMFSPNGYYTMEQGIAVMLKVYDLGVVVKLGEIIEISEKSVPLAKYRDNTESAELQKYSDEVVGFVNAARVKVGLETIVAADLLRAAANVRALELESKFSHTRPDGRECFTVFNDLGITYKYKGENLGMKYSTAEKCVTGWLESEFHRDIVLGKDYKRVGVGVHKSADGTLYWVLLLAD